MRTQKIKKFDVSNLELLRTKIKAALASLGEECNIQFNVGFATYSDDAASMKLKLETRAADGKPIDRARNYYLENANSFGLKPKWLDQTFTKGKYGFTVTGIDPDSRTFRVLTKRSDGKIFTWPIDAIREQFEPKTAKASAA